MKTETPAGSHHQVETVIESSTDENRIGKAVRSYIDGIKRLAYPLRRDLTNISPALASLESLRPVFEGRLEESVPLVVDIIVEVNGRSKVLRSPGYLGLLDKDISLWNNSTKGSAPIFGTLACVDKGIPAEAVMGLNGDMGRTLAGDINISYIHSKKSFIVVGSSILKRLIHFSRQEKGAKELVEPMMAHTNCGRMGQLLANESGGDNIPSLSYVFSHLDALASDFGGDREANLIELRKIQRMWESINRGDSIVKAPDKGLYASVIMKMAERQALLQSLSGHFNTKILPIEIYDKRNGDLIVGVDNLDILAHPDVIAAQGFTGEIIDSFVKSKKLFSIGDHRNEIEQLLKQNSLISQGSRTYSELQSNWLTVQKDFVDITSTLWKLFDNKNEVINKMVDQYITATGINKLISLKESNQPSFRRLIHHLFHTIAYSYVLDTFNRGNVPGDHIEDHLAIGDHEIGAKRHMALGQGDLDSPNASEMLTGYSVLLHSRPGKEQLPVIAMIKLDTDRAGRQSMSTEETNVAIGNFKEFLKLWPYFLVGDIIPVLAVREKNRGGISRLALSVILSFGDIDDLFEQENSPLPRFVPASTSAGEVVLIPADDILKAGLRTGGDLGQFRKIITAEADAYNNPEVQKAFRSYTG